MELTSDLVSRFGGLMSADDHTAMLAALKPQLLSSKPAVRRRAKDCLGYLAPSLSEALFADLIAFLVEYAGSSQAEHQRSSIQVACTSNTVSHPLNSSRTLGHWLRLTPVWCSGGTFPCYHCATLRSNLLQNPR